MDIKIYTTQFCPYCIRAKQLLTALNLKFESIDVGSDAELRNKLVQETGHMTVPIIMIDDKFIGGYDELAKLHAESKLV